MVTVALALRTGIPPAAWAAERPEVIEYALELLTTEHDD